MSAPTLPAIFRVGTLHHPRLRLRQPVNLMVERDRHGWISVTEPITGEWGYGAHLTAAVEDWQQTMAELYLYLAKAREGVGLGPAMATVWEQLQAVVAIRP